MGQNVLLLRQIAGDHLHALSHRHDNTCQGLCGIGWRHWWVLHSCETGLLIDTRKDTDDKTLK